MTATTHAPMMATPLPAHRIAKDLLGRSPNWFRQNKAALEKAGFPEPLPGIGLYDPNHVIAWRQAQYKHATAAGASGGADLAALHAGEDDDED